MMCWADAFIRYRLGALSEDPFYATVGMIAASEVKTPRVFLDTGRSAEEQQPTFDDLAARCHRVAAKSMWVPERIRSSPLLPQRARKGVGAILNKARLRCARKHEGPQQKLPDTDGRGENREVTTLSKLGLVSDEWFRAVTQNTSWVYMFRTSGSDNGMDVLSWLTYACDIMFIDWASNPRAVYGLFTSGGLLELARRFNMFVADWEGGGFHGQQMALAISYFTYTRRVGERGGAADTEADARLQSDDWDRWIMCEYGLVGQWGPDVPKTRVLEDMVGCLLINDIHDMASDFKKLEPRSFVLRALDRDAGGSVLNNLLDGGALAIMNACASGLTGHRRPGPIAYMVACFVMSERYCGLQQIAAADFKRAETRDKLAGDLEMGAVVESLRHLHLEGGWLALQCGSERVKQPEPSSRTVANVAKQLSNILAPRWRGLLLHLPSVMAAAPTLVIEMLEECEEAVTERFCAVGVLPLLLNEHYRLSGTTLAAEDSDELLVMLTTYSCLDVDEYDGRALDPAWYSYGLAVVMLLGYGCGLLRAIAELNLSYLGEEDGYENHDICLGGKPHGRLSGDALAAHGPQKPR